MEKEYLIVGSDNFWYASCMTSMKEAIEKIEEIKESPESFGVPYGGENQTEAPDTLYLYKAKLIKEIDLKVKEEKDD